MKKFNVLFPFFLLVLSLSKSFSQDIPIKFGDISVEDLSMSEYTPDKEAGAVFLCDYGITNLSFLHGKVEVIFERHFRIKILKDKGLEYSTIEIPYYSSFSFAQVKACSYSIDGDKIKKYRVKNSNYSDEATSDRTNIRKFIFPNVKTGSIIELKYSISSEVFPELPSWQFQHSIPVKHSEYTVTFPDYFVFAIRNQGYAKVKKTKKTLRLKQDKAGYLTGPTMSMIQGKRYNWQVDNVPSFKKEPYMPPISDCISKVSFDLAYFNVRGTEITDYKPVYSTLNLELLNDKNFYRALNRNRIIKDYTVEVTKGISGEKETMNTILGFIKQNIRWNGKTGIYVTNLKDVFERKEGNAAEINLLLISMLKDAGLNAEPVILSTRGHSRLHPVYIMSAKVNYVIASVKINGEEFLLDATESVLSDYLLPERCINGSNKGWRVSAIDPAKVDLSPKYPSGKIFNIQLSVNTDNELDGKVSISKSNYEAFLMRKELEKRGIEGYHEKLQLQYPDLTMSNYKIENTELPEKNTIETFECTTKNNIDKSGNTLIVNPFVFGRYTENPFNLSGRHYPVDFIYPFKETVIIVLNIPENYTIDKLPGAAIIRLPDNSGLFSYNTVQIGNKIQLSCKIEISKSVFSIDEYHELKEFFSKIVTKQAERIVLGTE